ncbi:MAG: copper homeostasis protein CutC [Bacteroidota bacterium]
MQKSKLPLLEICCSTIQSALNAEAGGADRIELCVGLEVGGLTPSPAMIRMALSKVNIPIHVLIRPRPGDFCYSPIEFEALKLDIQFCRMIGVAFLRPEPLLVLHL